MQRNDIRAAEQIVQTHLLRIRRFATRGREHFHPKRPAQPPDRAADPAVTDDAQRERGEFDDRPVPVAPFSPARPLTLANRARVQTGMIRQFEQQREDVLRDLSRFVTVHVRLLNPTRPCGGDVDDIEARR